MINFSSGYSYAEILQQMLGQVDDRLDKREGSLIQTALGPGAWYLEGLALALQQIQGEAFVESATGENLDYLAANRGLTRIAATSAVRQGTFDAPIPEGSTFKTINGADSVIFVSGDQISASGTTYAYELTCETPGIIGNSYTGPILPVTAISGLTSATIGTVITPGAEEETDAALRVRYKASFGAAGYGGNITEYRQAILAIAGVGGVQIYPANQYQGGGTTLCAIIADDFTAASPALVQTVQETICPPDENGVGPSPNGYGVAPIGAAVTIQSATQLSIDVSATIVFNGTIVNGLELYSDQIKEAIGDYITSVAASWGDPLVARQVSYPVTVYAVRIIYAILAAVPEVVNVTDLTLNGVSGDLTLTETAALQQVPVLGEVTLSE